LRAWSEEIEREGGAYVEALVFEILYNAHTVGMGLSKDFPIHYICQKGVFVHVKYLDD